PSESRRRAAGRRAPARPIRTRSCFESSRYLHSGTGRSSKPAAGKRQAMPSGSPCDPVRRPATAKITRSWDPKTRARATLAAERASEAEAKLGQGPGEVKRSREKPWEPGRLAALASSTGFPQGERRSALAF